MKKSSVFLAVALCSSLWGPSAWANCYVLYDAAQTVVYRSVRPPVDLSLALHQALPKVLPDGTLVFTPDNSACDFEVDELDRLANKK